MWYCNFICKTDGVAILQVNAPTCYTLSQRIQEGLNLFSDAGLAEGAVSLKIWKAAASPVCR